ncbi:MAG: hypothetical protein ABJC62_14170 [Frankiaceae bacterium]
MRVHSQNNNIKLRDVAAGVIRSCTGHDPVPVPEFTEGHTF